MTSTNSNILRSRCSNTLSWTSRAHPSLSCPMFANPHFVIVASWNSYHQTFNLDSPKSYLLPSAFYSLVIAQFNPLFVNLASIHPSPLHRYGRHLFSSIWDRYPWSSINVSKQHYGEMMISLKVDPHNYIDLFSSIEMFWSSIKHLKQI